MLINITRSQEEGSMAAATVEINSTMTAGGTMKMEFKPLTVLIVNIEGHGVLEIDMTDEDPERRVLRRAERPANG